MTGEPTATLPALIADGALDAELGSLLWLLAGSGVPVHVAAADTADARRTAAAVAPFASDAANVTSGQGERLEDVLRLPVPLRPAAGVVVIVSAGRIVAAHFLRPPLRDAGGHVRPQGPAVLATWDERLRTWEHFAWGVAPELAAAARRRAGDFEIEQGRRRAFLETLVGLGVRDPDRVGAAVAGYSPGSLDG